MLMSLVALFLVLFIKIGISDLINLTEPKRQRMKEKDEKIEKVY